MEQGRMAKKARKFSVEFKREAVRRMAEATTIVGLAEKLGVRRKLLYQWRDQKEAEQTVRPPCLNRRVHSKSVPEFPPQPTFMASGSSSSIIGMYRR
jgi:transposase-like protein